MDEVKARPQNSCPLTPLTFLERAATIYADCPSIIYNTITYTWFQTYSRCLKVASSIASLGIHRNDVVSVIAPNIPAMYELHFAAPMAGSVLNTINFRLNAHTVYTILHHSESKLVFVDCQSKSLILEALSLFPPKSPLPLLVLIQDDEFPTLKTSDFISTYEELVEKKDDKGFTWVGPETEFDPIVLNYTSGTTAAPKGVVHSHRGIFISTLDCLLEWSVPNQAVYLWTLPMFHANGWCYTWGMAVVGGTNICLRKFDAKIIYTSISKYNVTHLCAAPVVLNMLSNFPDSKPLEHRVYTMTGGSPPPAAVLFRIESLGFVVQHGYGLTETAGVAISCTWKHHWNKLPATERARLKSRQGVKTLRITQVDVVNPESGISVMQDGTTVGEIVLKGSCIMLGYLKDPEGTSKCMKDDGWFYTGDLAVIHPDGYLEIKGRDKDVIISGGENLSSVEIESVLYTHPVINEAAVVARPDEFWGETPCAFVTLNKEIKQETSEKDIIEFCRAKLPHFMAPKTVVFKQELPKTATGKIQKFLLREIAQGMAKSSSSSMTQV